MLQLLLGDAADARSAILEVRAGTRGEAALLAGELFRMYRSVTPNFRLAVSGHGSARPIWAA